jgi:Protein of unknown function (DUF4238)
MTPPHRHHFIPRFQLRLFATGKNREVAVYDKTKDRIEMRTDSRAATIAGFYSFPTPGGGVAEDLERHLSRIETKAAPIIRRLAEVPPPGFVLSAQDRGHLATYFGTLHNRVPAVVSLFHGAASQGIQERADRYQASDLQDDARLRDRIREDHPGSTEKQQDEVYAFLQTYLRQPEPGLKLHRSAGLLAVVAGRDIGAEIGSLNWAIVRKRTFPLFVMGDSPALILQDPDATAEASGRMGSSAIVLVYLGPFAVLVASRRATDGKVHDIDAGDLGPLPFRLLDSQSGGPLPLGLTYSVIAWTTAERYVYGSSRRGLEELRKRLGPMAMRPGERNLVRMPESS